MVRAPSEKNWDYQACMFTIDARSGTQISQIRLDERRPVTSLYQPIVAETSDGKIRLTLDEFSTVYGRGLEVAAARQPITPSKEHWTGAHWKMFRAERDGTLWYDGSSEAKLLGKYTPDATFIYPLGPERVLVIAGKRFALFRGDGTQVKNEASQEKECTLRPFPLTTENLPSLYIYGASVTPATWRRKGLSCTTQKMDPS
jgi:hypothetical protein